MYERVSLVRGLPAVNHGLPEECTSTVVHPTDITAVHREHRGRHGGQHHGEFHGDFRVAHRVSPWAPAGNRGLFSLMETVSRGFRWLATVRDRGFPRISVITRGTPRGLPHGNFSDKCI